MGFIKDFKEIKKKVEEIHKSVNNKIIYKASKYDEVLSYLKNIVFDLKIDKYINELGEIEYKLTYSLPSVKMKFDEKGELQDNILFASINMLDLLKIEDTNKLLNIIKEEKIKKSKK